MTLFTQRRSGDRKARQLRTQSASRGAGSSSLGLHAPSLDPFPPTLFVSVLRVSQVILCQLQLCLQLDPWDAAHYFGSCLVFTALGCVLTMMPLAAWGCVLILLPLLGADHCQFPLCLLAPHWFHGWAVCSVLCCHLSFALLPAVGWIAGATELQ